MLNKDICRRCFVKGKGLKWGAQEDWHWERGQVWCPYRVLGAWKPIGEPPPQGCPWVLEHMMSHSQC